MVGKIIKALKNGTFFPKSISYISKKVPLCVIKNRNVRTLVEQEHESQKLSRQYNSLIQKGVSRDEIGAQRSCNKIWICWLQGLDQAPKLVKACIHSIKQNFPNKKIVILSENNIHQYITFPSFINEKRRKGIISDAHFSDLVRCALLCQYGGLWVDATVLCTSPNMGNYISSLPLFVFKQMDLTRRDRNPILASNWLMSAQSNQRILLLTQKLLYAYWSNHNFAENYFIFHIFFALAAYRYPEDWKAIPMFNNNSPHTLQFELNNDFDKTRWKQILRMSDFHKLNHHNDYSQNPSNYYHYILRHYLG